MLAVVSRYGTVSHLHPALVYLLRPGVSIMAGLVPYLRHRTPALTGAAAAECRPEQGVVNGVSNNGHYDPLGTVMAPRICTRSLRQGARVPNWPCTAPTAPRYTLPAPPGTARVHG